MAKATILIVEDNATSRELMETLSWVRRNESSNLDNIRLTDEALATKEAALYQLARGDTMVELTTSGVFGRDPLGLSPRGRQAYVYAAEVLLVLIGMAAWKSYRAR